MTWTERLLCRLLHNHERSQSATHYFYRCTTKGCGLLRIVETPAERIRRLARKAACEHITKAWHQLTGGK